MRIFRLFSLFALVFALASAGFAQKAARTTIDSQSETRITSSQKRFGLKLFGLLASENDSANVFFSPASVAWCLSMVMNGAGGQTRQEMERVLEVSGINIQDLNASYAEWQNSRMSIDPGVELEVANSVWARSGAGVRQEFLEITKRFYSADTTELNFDDPGSITAINSWVKNKTRGKIDKIIEQIEPESVLFLLNAIYFKGTWTEEFDPAETREENFSSATGRKKLVKMMRRRGMFRYSETPDFQAVSLPYGNGRMSMYVFLPSENLGLAGFQKKLTSTAWDSWISGFEEREGLLVLPRFSAEYDVTLNGALKALGMISAFDPQQADFNAMLQNSKNAFISKVKHKAFVEVNEEGTEATAATSAEAQIVSMRIPSKTFQMVVDRPFVLAICDNKTGALLFLGSISDPVSHG